MVRQERNGFIIIRTMFGLPGYKSKFLAVWLLIYTLFLWLPQINLLSYIITQAPLTLAGKLTFFIGYYPRILSSITNPMVLSLLIFSMLTALSIVLLIFMLRTARRLDYKTDGHSRAYAATAGSAIGSHMLACGGTILLAALFPAFSVSSAALGGSSASINQWLSTSANFIGIAIVLYTIRKISRECIAMIIKQPIKRSSYAAS